ncbi:MAG: DUF58 domain-containing protein [Clostridiales bacterium]|nr:DUF58 domain-containing protein [Clostridiales bacterium]
MNFKGVLRYSAVLLVTAFLFFFFRSFFFFYVFLISLLLPVLSFTAAKYVMNRCEFDIAAKCVQVGTGSDIPVEFKVKNSSLFPMSAVRFEYTVRNNFYPNDEVQVMTLPLRRGECYYSWSIGSVYAGRVIVSCDKIVTDDFLRIFRFEKEAGIEAGVNVFPKPSDFLMQHVETLFSGGEEQTADSLNSTEDVTKVKEFRPYRPGDRMSRVNWKISAKHDDIYVKEFEREFSRTLTLLFEIQYDSGDVGSLDEIITAVYSAAIRLIDMEYRFRIQWYDSENGAFRAEFVEETDNLDAVMEEVFLMKSYQGSKALDFYNESEHRPDDTTLYFTPYIAGSDIGENTVTVFEGRVKLIWL